MKRNLFYITIIICFSLLTGFFTQKVLAADPTVRELLQHYGETGVGLTWDLNNDSLVNAQDFGVLVKNSYPSLCGNGNLDQGEECDDSNKVDGDGCSSTCSLENGTKDTNKYSAKEVFIVSDSSWTNPVEFVSSIVWTSSQNAITKYPLLILHEESSTAFDADSIIHFLQQYAPTHVTVIGSVPSDFSTLLTTSAPVGAGLTAEQVGTVNLTNLLSYWTASPIVVYSENDYATAINASTYASLKNAPLVIQGTSLDIPGTFAGRFTICIGNVSPSGSSCAITFTNDSVKDRYKEITNTDKIILINPTDLNIYVSQSFQPEHSATAVSRLFTKTSLIAPYLASARHELIIASNQTDWETYNTFIKSEFNHFFGAGYDGKYLTVIAGPTAIQYRKQEPNIGSWPNHKALDHVVYADFDADNLPEVYAGRVMGFTNTDASTMIARDLFYTTLNKTDNYKFMASSFSYMISRAEHWGQQFTSAGYNGVSSTSTENAHSFSSSEWLSQDLVSYADHGSENWAGMSSSSLPELNGSQVYVDACSTCASDANYSFCEKAIRRGATFYLGEVSIGWTGNDTFRGAMSGQYHDNYTIGEAITRNYSSSQYYWMTSLIGDPAFRPYPDHTLSSELDWQ